MFFFARFDERKGGESWGRGQALHHCKWLLSFSEYHVISLMTLYK
jgi:hypothetical protein